MKSNIKVYGMIVGGFVMLIAISVAFQFYYSLTMHSNEQFAKLDIASEKLNTYLKEYDRKALGVANVAGVLWEFKKNCSDADLNDSLLADYLYNSSTYFPEAAGIGVWYEAYKYNTDRQYCGPYVYWQKDSMLLTWQYSNEKYDYLNQSWFTTTLPPGWDRRLRRPSRTYWSEAYYDSLLHQMVIPVCAPIYNYEDNILGVASVNLGFEKFAKYINKVDAGETYKSVVIALHNEIILANSIEPNLIGKTAETLRWYQSLRNSVNHRKPIRLSFRLNGTQFSGFFKKINNDIIYGIIVDEVKMKITSFYTSVGLVGGGLLLMFAVLIVVRKEINRKQQTYNETVLHLELFRKMFSDMPDAGLIIDSKNDVIDYSKSFSDMFAVCKTDTEKINLSQVLNSETEYELITNCITQMKTGDLIEMESVCRRSNCETFPAMLRIYAIKDNSTHQVMISIADLSVQKNQFDEMQSINDDLNECLAKYKEKLAESEKLLDKERNSNSRLFSLSESMKTELEELQNRLADESAKVIGLNDELVRKEKMILLSEKAKNKYIGVIAHDLKTPVNTIHHASEAWLRGLETFDMELSNQYCNTIYKSSMFLSEILDDLLIWNRSQTGNIICSPVFEQISSIVDDVIDLQSNAAESKKIKIINSIDSNIKVFIDIIMTRTVILNLVSNAIKYSERNSEIIVGCNTEAENGFRTFYVKDNGIGMDTFVMENIFKNDVLYSKRGTENELGTGFGLFITKEFIEKQGGRIWAVSTPCEGSTFYFSLPDSET